MEQFILHICGEAPFVFAINSVQVGYVERDYESIDILIDKQDFILSLYPLTQSTPQGTSISYSAKIFAKGGKLISNNDKIVVTDYGGSHFKVCASPFIIPFQSTYSPTFSAQVNDCFININKNTINISNSKTSRFYPLPINIQNIQAKEICDLTVISGATQDNKTYHLYFDKNLQAVFDGIADKIEYDGTQIVTLQNISDIARHGLVTTYKKSISGFTKNQQYAVYTQNEAVAPASNITIPWAFMEAVNIANYTLARSYLHPSLSASLQDNHIAEYFGEFLEVTPTLNNTPYDLSLVYAGNPRFVKTYHFEVNENRIVNIDCIN